MGYAANKQRFHPLCKVHNSIAVYAAIVSLLYSLSNRSLVGSCGWFTSYIALANTYVNHLYLYHLPTWSFAGIDHLTTLLPE